MALIEVQAVYEDGILKLLEPVDLINKQVVKLHIEVTDQPRRIVQLAGLFSAFLEDEAPTLEELQAITNLSPSLERLQQQINGIFDDDTNP